MNPCARFVLLILTAILPACDTPVAASANPSQIPRPEALATPAPIDVTSSAVVTPDYPAMTPAKPCVGQTVTVTGTVQPNSDVVIWLDRPVWPEGGSATGPRRTLMPLSSPEAAIITRLKADNDGRLNGQFGIPRSLGPNKAGGTSELRPENRYLVYAEYPGELRHLAEITFCP